MEASAALRTIVRRDTGESYRAMLTRMAQESGIETPTAEDLARFDRKRKGKTLSNADWESPTDTDARIAKMKDGTTHLAYKPEHAVASAARGAREGVRLGVEARGLVPSCEGRLARRRRLEAWLGAVTDAISA